MHCNCCGVYKTKDGYNHDRECIHFEVINYLCDNCGSRVLPTGEVLTVYPPTYIHQCTKCNRYYNFKVEFGDKNEV